MKVKNKKIITKLSFRSLKAAKLRNIMAIIAIALTSILFTSLFTLGIGVVDGFQQATMRQSGTSAHGVLKYINDEIYDDVKDHELIEGIAYSKMLTDSIENEGFLKRPGEFKYIDENGLKWSFYEPTTGTIPKAENEVIMDTKSIELLGIPKEIGAKLQLELKVKGNIVKRDFILSGWWEADPSFKASIIIGSKAYADAHSDELYYSYKDDYLISGSINADIMFKNSFNMQDKLDKIISDSGYQNTDNESKNYIASNINWAYLSSGMGGDMTTTLIIIVALLIILLTGYLIIYNIFQISVLRDIRFYGLLKTIGTTGKQIKSIISKQALTLSIIGIPVGLLLGFNIGVKLVPLIISNTAFNDAIIIVKPNPIIFIGSGLFSLLTIWISTRKPGKIAANVSPVEAVKYTDIEEIKQNKIKKSTNGGKITKMALSNLGRNKKRSILVLISLTLSLVLLNSVFTLSQGMDMDKYLSTFVDTDFLVANANYFNNTHFYGLEDTVDESLMKEINNHDGFLEGGKLYFTQSEVTTVEDPNYTDEINTIDGDPMASLYGLDDLPLGRLKILDGEIDIDKLKSGKYIIYAILTDDNQKPIMDVAHYSVGDMVKMHNYKFIDDDNKEDKITEFEVMATVKYKYYTASNRYSDDYAFYLPSEVYLPLKEDKAIMSYAYNLKDGYEDEMEDFIKNATETIYPDMHYESKLTHIKEFENLSYMFLSIGGILSLIVGIIGILNFINAMLTSIITRKRELAMLESIGMTRIQIRNMIILESVYYAIGTIILSFILCVLTSVFLLKPLLGNMWFMSYKFVIAPVVISWPFLILLAIILPIISIKFLLNETVVERLNETE